jgi:methionine salvage enolase-phosphatase E1
MSNISNNTKVSIMLAAVDNILKKFSQDELKQVAEVLQIPLLNKDSKEDILKVLNNYLSAINTTK